jgi:hypothetical protein
MACVKSSASLAEKARPGSNAGREGGGRMEGSGSACDGPAPAPDHVYLFGHESWASWRRAPGALDQRPMQAVQATAESRPPRHQIRWASGIKLGGRAGNLSARRCGLDAPVKMGLASYMARSAAAQRLGEGSKQTPRRHPGRHCQRPPKFRHPSARPR